MAIGFLTCADTEEGEGDRGPDPLENHKNIGIFSNTGPDPLKIVKLPCQQSIMGQIGTAAKRFAGEPMMAR